jgi:hypothetical protein
LISWRALLDEAQPLAIGPVDDEFLDRAVAGLRGVKLHPPGPHGFRYPGHVDQLASARAALEAAARVSPDDAHLLRAALRRPLRAYPLVGSPPNYALLGAWRINDQIEPRIVVVNAGGTHVDPAAYAVGETQDALLAAMEQLYIDMDHVARDAPDPSRRNTDRVLWIGGSDTETGDPTWRSRVAAVMMTEGFATVIREHPGRDPVATARAASELSGAAVIAWIPRLGNPGLAASIMERSQLRVIELSEYDFGDALDELRLVLEAEPLAGGLTAEEETPPTFQFDSGDPYYFKKIAKRGAGVDLVIHRREPCSHESWTVVHGAPQARKGIENYSGRTIRKLEHCDRCTGGGMWRVSFD